MKTRNFFPQQRCVRIHRQEVIKNSGKLFANIYKDNILSACRDLKPNTFKIWLYMASNKQNYSMEFSPSYLSKVLNISTQTAKNAFTELKEKGYLVDDNSNKYFYDFYETPQNNVIDMNKKKTFRDEYLDGSYDEYEISFRDLVEACGIEEALQYWRGENQYERL